MLLAVLGLPLRQTVVHVETFTWNASRVLKRLSPFFSAALLVLLLLPWVQRPFWCMRLDACDLNARYYAAAAANGGGNISLADAQIDPNIKATVETTFMLAATNHHALHLVVLVILLIGQILQVFFLLLQSSKRQPANEHKACRVLTRSFYVFIALFYDYDCFV